MWLIFIETQEYFPDRNRLGIIRNNKLDIVEKLTGYFSWNTIGLFFGNILINTTLNSIFNGKLHRWYCRMYINFFKALCFQF